jgi:hypothetical protein
MRFFTALGLPLFALPVEAVRAAVVAEQRQKGRSKAMISDEELYKTLCDMLAERNRNALDAFKLFISLYSAIVGGAIWLSTQATKMPVSYGRLSTGVVILVTFVAIVLVIEAKRGWWGYRKAQSELVGKNDQGKYRIPPPKLFPTVITEGAMVIAMAVAGFGFYWFNPLQPSN